MTGNKISVGLCHGTDYSLVAQQGMEQDEMMKKNCITSWKYNQEGEWLS